MRIKVAQFGLGPIGLATANLAASKQWLQVVGAVDIDPAKEGKDLGELAGHKNLRGVRIHASIEELLKQARPDVVLHTTVSKFNQAFPQLEAIAKHGISVVSSCEELVFPQLSEPHLGKKLDALCKRSGARVVGTGVNPGFVMDVLPLCLSSVSCAVRSIHIQRVVNASTRREPLQRKIGSGLPPRRFGQLLRTGQAGHAGLKESLALVAHSLGWKLSSIREQAKPVVADRAIRTAFLTVKKGETCGVHQRAEGKVGGQTVLSLELRMYLDAVDPHDAIQVEGEPPLDLIVKNGVAGDQATVGALINCVPRILEAEPGLRLLPDLPLPRFRG